MKKYDANLSKLYQVREREREQKFNILEELKEFEFKNKRIFSPNIIQIFDSLKTLKNSGFSVRAIVSDNHSAIY